MYKKILLALENSPSDRALISHVATLAKMLNSAMCLVHVAEGFAARNFEQLKLAESQEIKEDRAYLEKVRGELAALGLEVEAHLAMGNPPDEIVKAAAEQDCDLIAMASHGHRFLADVIHGSTIEPVRHKTSRPVLLVRGGDV